MHSAVRPSHRTHILTDGIIMWNSPTSHEYSSLLTLINGPSCRCCRKRSRSGLRIFMHSVAYHEVLTAHMLLSPGTGCSPLQLIHPQRVHHYLQRRDAVWRSAFLGRKQYFRHKCRAQRSFRRRCSSSTQYHCGAATSQPCPLHL